MQKIHNTQDVPQSPRVPVELLHLIAHTTLIDAVKRGDIEIIKACSLTFSDWRVSFQGALLEAKGVSLTFTNTRWIPGLVDSHDFASPYPQRQRVRALRDILDANPSFGKAIRSLGLRIVDEDCLGESSSALTVASMLSLFTNVETFSFSQSDNIGDSGGYPHQRNAASWANFSPSLQSAIVGLFRSSSLKHLTIGSFDGPSAIILPENVELETLVLGIGISSPELIDVSLDEISSASTDVLPAVHSSARPCIARHLASVSANAFRLVQATHQHRGVQTAVINPCGMHSFQAFVTSGLDVAALQQVLLQTLNLRKLIVFYGPAPDGPPRLFRFHGPLPLCISHELEDAEINFYWGRRPGVTVEVPMEAISAELAGYPSRNVLKRITLKAYIHCDISQIAGGLEREGLMQLFTQTLGASSSFPSLRSVDFLPILSRENTRDPVAEEAFVEEMEQVAVALRAMNLPLSFRFMKLKVLENRGETKVNWGIDQSIQQARRHNTQDVPPSPRVPVKLLADIAHTIRIDATESGDTETIKACSLVFSGWRILFQSALLEIKGVSLVFTNSKWMTSTADRGSPRVSFDPQRKRVRALCDLLDANPSFGKAITSLTLHIVDEDCLGKSNSALTVASMLTLLTNVKTLSFSRFDSDNLGRYPDPRRRGSWESFSPSLQDAIVGLFRSSSLKHLTVASFDGPLAVMLPEGGEIDTLILGTGLQPPEFVYLLMRDLGHQTIGSADTVMPIQNTMNLCIVRHLVSMSYNVDSLVRATRLPDPLGGQNVSTAVINFSAILSFQVKVSMLSESRETQVVLSRATSLKELKVFYEAPAPVELFIFKEPRPLCLSRHLEVLEMAFRWGGESGQNVCMKTISTELGSYPPNNVLNHITLKAYFQSDISSLCEERQDLTDLFSKTLRARSTFPALRSVDFRPILSSYEPRDRTDEVQAFSGELEKVALELGAMKLPFALKFMKLKALDNWKVPGGLDREDARWYRFVSEDNVIRA